MDTIRVVARQLAAGRSVVTYEELGLALGVPGIPQQGHGPYLRASSQICEDWGWPDIAPCVVTKASLEIGAPMPSDGVFDDSGHWAASGLAQNEVAEAQRRAREFDWIAIKGLWPKGK